MITELSDMPPKFNELCEWIRELLRLGLYSEALLIVDSLNQEQLQRRYSIWRLRRIRRDCDEVCSLPPRFADLRVTDAGVAAEAAAGALAPCLRVASDDTST
jgi:hypothetical protein